MNNDKSDSGYILHPMLHIKHKSQTLKTDINSKHANSHMPKLSEGGNV